MLGACAALLTACGTVHSARMWFPKSFGMDEVNPRLYVEPTMTAEQLQVSALVQIRAYSPVRRRFLPWTLGRVGLES